MMSISQFSVSGMCAALAVVVSAWAAPTALADDDSKTMDQKFLKMAAKSSMYEVKAGEYVSKTTKNQDVKAFADLMVKDHKAALGQLKTEARRLDVDWPDDLMDVDEEKLEKLQDKKGPELDMAYVFGQVGTHAEAILWHECQAEHGSDSQVKTMAAEMLTALKEHKEHADDLARKLIDQKKDKQ